MAVKISLLFRLQHMVSRPVCASIPSRLPTRAFFAVQSVPFLIWVSCCRQASNTFAELLGPTCHCCWTATCTGTFECRPVVKAQQVC